MAMQELRGILPSDPLPETADLGGIPRDFVRVGADGVTRITAEGLAVDFTRQMIADVSVDQWIEYTCAFVSWLFNSLVERDCSIQGAVQECTSFKDQVLIELARHRDGLLASTTAGTA